MTTRLWREDQVRGKLDIYLEQMGRPSNNGRYETLRELAGDLITQYAPIYQSIGEYRERLAKGPELFGVDISKVKLWDVPVGVACLLAAAAYAPR